MSHELDRSGQFDEIDDYQDETCGECGGEGYIVADCFEDTCCCADPELEHGLIVCPNCTRRGKARRQDER